MRVSLNDSNEGSLGKKQQKKADHSMRIPIFEDRTPRRRGTTIKQRFIAKGL